MITETIFEKYEFYKKFVDDIYPWIRDNIEKSPIKSINVRISDIKNAMDTDENHTENHTENENPYYHKYAYLKDDTIVEIFTYLMFFRHNIIIEKVGLKDTSYAMKMRKMVGAESLSFPKYLKHFMKALEE